MPDLINKATAAFSVRLASLFRRLRDQEHGMVSAEYAVGILAAIGFALLLMAVLKSQAVRDALTGIVVDGLKV